MARFWVVTVVLVAVAIAGLLTRRAAFFASPPLATRSSTVETSEGPVNLPIRYYDGSLIGAFWLIEPAKAAGVLPKTLEPLVLPGLGAVAGLFMFEYR